MSDYHRRLPESLFDPRVLAVAVAYSILAVIGALATAVNGGVVAVVPLVLTTAMIVIAAGLWLCEQYL